LASCPPAILACRFSWAWRAAQRLEKLGEGALDAPEDVHVDAAAGGALYTATRDGWLHKMHPGNSSWERWRFVGGTGLLGVTPSADGTMLVCDADKVSASAAKFICCTEQNRTALYVLWWWAAAWNTYRNNY
jgi:hypothetical protein